ncbi:DUF6233 domain-containing protein [Streptomyces rubiginosohelvolus]|uniref:DUF6233 domain-containing protein n=1 Tax=Streptomyces rubiginosohelvolus TaxID=67362 RepID=UPI00342126CC
MPGPSRCGHWRVDAAVGRLCRGLPLGLAVLGHLPGGLAEAGIGVSTTEVYRCDCWVRGRTLRPVTAERARAELAGGAQSCGVCRPDRVLNRL